MDLLLGTIQSIWRDFRRISDSCLTVSNRTDFTIFDERDNLITKNKRANWPKGPRSIQSESYGFLPCWIYSRYFREVPLKIKRHRILLSFCDIMNLNFDSIDLSIALKSEVLSFVDGAESHS